MLCLAVASIADSAKRAIKQSPGRNTQTNQQTKVKLFTAADIKLTILNLS